MSHRKTVGSRKQAIKTNYRHDLIKQLRLECGLSLAELGKLCGLSGMGIYKIELGNEIKVSTLWKLAEAFGVDPRIFLDMDFKLKGKTLSDKKQIAEPRATKLDQVRANVKRRLAKTATASV